MRILITGITGTIGTALSSLLLGEGHEIVGLSRDEFKQHHWPLKDRVKLYIGDVSNLDDCFLAGRGCDLIIHTAALKHVDKMELNPLQAIRTNIVGTSNLVKMRKGLNIDRLVLLSTDKAVYPINVYGNTKAIAERLVLQDEGMVIRYGNVINSRGSVIETFSKQAEKGAQVTITNSLMTRFFITIQEVASFIANLATDLTVESGLYIPPMKACYITDLAKAVYEVINPDKTPEFISIGMRPGEKINECLLGRYEDVKGYYHDCKGDLYSDRVERFSRDELFEIITGECE